MTVRPARTKVPGQPEPHRLILVDAIQETPQPLTPEVSNFTAIRDRLRALYLGDPRPWLVGFSGGKDSTMLASLGLLANSRHRPRVPTRTSMQCSCDPIPRPSIPPLRLPPITLR